MTRATKVIPGIVPRSWWQLIKQTFADSSEDKTPRLGAALAYYAIFSIPPLLVIAIAIAGFAFDPAEVQNGLNAQFKTLVGEEGQQAIAVMMQGAQQHQQGVIATVIGVTVLLFGATGVFVQLKDALNTIWGVRIKAGVGLWSMMRDYFLSFTMVLGIGFLLLVSLILSALLTAALAWFKHLVPLPGGAAYALEMSVSFLVVTLLFAMIFKVLPDVEISWRDVWLGAAVTSVLFTVGKFLIGVYLGWASVSSTYGAAGTLVVVLIWAYYSAQILLLGAEFTKVYATMYGTRIRPAEMAEPVTQEAKAEQGIAS